MGVAARKTIDHDAVCDVLWAAQDAAEVRRFAPHYLRHLYCPALQEKPDASSKVAQDRLVHANAATTAKIYTNVDDDLGASSPRSLNRPSRFLVLAYRKQSRGWALHDRNS